ncbi:unnamed protein product [Ambrosiozyma monospora]|uniref:Unnamed protein product n=1 Tax=Ambrosiozyma monospora TaxID=43982 RepID=A0A9W6YTG6_AMBMO|nr:unnamed protein product [Ambrosiozyma monospora]
MGHESISEVVSVGSEVKTVKPGDEVIAVFTTQCGHCFYCDRGLSSKCDQSVVFGTSALDGFQAEYTRVPLADATLKLKPEGIPDLKLVLMCDIFPTAFFGVKNLLNKFEPKQIKDLVELQMGCGPVGLLAIIIAKALGVKTLFAVDFVPERLKLAEKFGAIPINLKTDDVDAILKKATDGRGPDGVLEVVGSKDALDIAFKVVRYGGVINSIGYQHSELPFTGLDCYMKNIILQFGRCPAASLFDESLVVFKKVQGLLDGFVDLELPLSSAVEGYELFDRQGARKLIFRPHDLTEPVHHEHQ